VPIRQHEDKSSTLDDNFVLTTASHYSGRRRETATVIVELFHLVPNHSWGWGCLQIRAASFDYF